MKKILLVIALILFFIVPAVAGPKTAEHPKQAGKSSIYFYDVECPANPDPECEVCGPCTGHGRFVIEAAKKTFNFIGHDFTPNRGVEISGIGNFIVKGKVTPSGKPDEVKPMNSGMEEQEQKGVTVPNSAAMQFAQIP